MRRHFNQTRSKENDNLALETIDELLNEPFVFLGGTINGSRWREKMLPLLEVPYFDPVVTPWTAEDAQREQQAKNAAKINLFVVTPKQHGFYTIAEMMYAAMWAQLDKQVVIVFLNEDDGVTFDEHQIKSNQEVLSLACGYNSAHGFETLEAAAHYINTVLIEAAR